MGKILRYGIPGLMFLFLALTDSLAQRSLVNLRGTWKFTIGDNPGWKDPGYDDSNWETVYAPSSWEDQGFHGYDGYAWYRKTFELDLENTDVMIKLGYIDDVDEVFINGMLVGFSGRFPPHYTTSFNSRREYVVPADFLIKGTNVIAVRVFDAQLTGGILKGDLRIIEAYRTNDVKPLLSLRGIWDFRVGDNVQWSKPQVNTADWSKIIVPSGWERQGYYKLNGVAWYRKTFEGQGLPKSDVYLVLGKIDDFDQVWLNGVMVGSTNDGKQFGESTSYRELRTYLIPDNLLKEGINTIAVRVVDLGIDGGIYQGPVGIYDLPSVNGIIRRR